MRILTKIVLTGRIQTGSYTNRDGQKVYTTDIVVEEQEFAESKAAAAGNSGQGNYSRSSSAPSDTNEFMTIPDNIDDDHEQAIFAEAGLNYDELEFMDPEERRKVLEDAGLDPDEFDF